MAVNKWNVKDIGNKEIKTLAKLYLTDDEELISTCTLCIHDKMDLSVGSLHVFNNGSFNTSGHLVEVL